MRSTTNTSRQAAGSAPDRAADVVLDARDVCKTYGSREVLRQVTLAVRRGEVACIIGPSGGGKSTFLRCVNHLEPVDGGSISVDGEHIGYRRQGNVLHECHEREIARQRAAVGMVFQHFNLFPHLSALENIVLAPVKVLRQDLRAAQESAQALLHRVGLGDRASSYPHELSGGQQQRVAIARALAMRPKLMLFDEPTSALDAELVGEVLDVIRDLAAEGMTMVAVTHELAFARELADVVHFMANGRLLESGPPDEILSRPREDRTRAFLARVLSSHEEATGA